MDAVGSEAGWMVEGIALVHLGPALLLTAFSACAGVARKSRNLSPETRRLVVGAVLSLAVAGWITVVHLEVQRPPTAALPRRAVRVVQGVCRADLRPSSSSSRSIPLEITEIRTQSGWTGSAGGRAHLVWSGPEYLTTFGNAGTVAPTRGDVVEVTAAFPAAGHSVIWAESDEIRVKPAEGSLATGRRRAREFIRRRLARLPQEAYTIALALLLGTRAEMSREMIAAVRGAGASHVIALSGMHLGVLALLLNKVTSRVGSPRMRRLVVAGALFGYVWIAGWIPSLLRALILACLILGSRDRDRSLPPEILLGRCVLLTAVVAPEMVWTVGFQLSLWALVGLFFLSPRLVELLAWVMPVPIARYIGVTLGPLLTTGPVSLSVFGTVYPVGLVSAGVLALVAVVLMWGSMVFIALAAVPIAGSLIADGLTAVTVSFTGLSAVFAAVPGVDLGEPGGLISLSAWCTLLAVAVGSAVFLSRRRRREFFRFLESHGKPQFDF